MSNPFQKDFLLAQSDDFLVHPRLSQKGYKQYTVFLLTIMPHKPHFAKGASFQALLALAVLKDSSAHASQQSTNTS